MTESDTDPWPAAIARAHAVWPAAWVTDDVLVEHLRSRAGDDATELAIEDLYLALACALGVPAAVEELVRTRLCEVEAHVAHIDRSPAFADEVRQVLAEKLLVAGADGRVPAIADYGGRAPLSAWLRVAAIRAALNLRRGKANQVEPDHDRELAGLAGADDVALDAIRARYRPAFEAALARALAELPVRDRTLLRLRWIEGVGLEQLATMYGVHRATVTRWLADCRAQLAERARAILADELGATSRELDSLAELVRSQLHISVVRLLQT